MNVRYAAMNILKKFLCRIGHFLLSIVRVLRRAICCRRRKEADYLLPLTVDQVIDFDSHKSPDLYEYQSHWAAWPENENSSSIPSNSKGEKSTDSQKFHQEESPDDFFKDMVPQIRKPKKIYIRKDAEEREDKNSSNRLAMDPKAILTDTDLGILDDNPSNWEDGEHSEEMWEANQLLRETKKVEREKRLAEHQRRKQERENRRASRQDSSSNMAILNLSDSKAKFS